MSIKNTSDYEIISNAEMSSVIDKYSPAMIDMTLLEILKNKSKPHITPMSNIVCSYEANFTNDMKLYEQLQQNMIEVRSELYYTIMNRVCEFHQLELRETNYDIYTSASIIYDFLVSGFYHKVISFFVNYLRLEENGICSMLDREGFTKNQAISHLLQKGEVNTGTILIHNNLPYVLDSIASFDISLEDIINVIYRGTYEQVSYGQLLKDSLADKGDFYKNFIIPTISGFNRAEAVTNIRLQMIPAVSNFKDYLIDNEDN